MTKPLSDCCLVPAGKGGEKRDFYCPACGEDCEIGNDEETEMYVNSILACEERVSREYHKPKYDTVLHKAANQVAAVILLMFVATIFVLLIITPDGRVTGRTSSGAVQEVIR